MQRDQFMVRNNSPFFRKLDTANTAPPSARFPKETQAPPTMDAKNPSTMSYPHAHGPLTRPDGSFWQHNPRISGGRQTESPSLVPSDPADLVGRKP